MKNNYIVAILVVAAIVAAAAITYSIVRKESDRGNDTGTGAGTGNNTGAGAGTGTGNNTGGGAGTGNSGTGPKQNPNTFTPSSNRLAVNPLALGNSGKNYNLPGTLKNTLKRI